VRFLLCSSGISNPRIHDARQTAIKVVDGNIDVVTEGQWKPISPKSTSVRQRSGTTP
jgi:hypothetical protein